MMTLDEHLEEAAGYVAMADRTRNSDHFRGDRDAAALAQATIAQAHATIALAMALTRGKIYVADANAV